MNNTLSLQVRTFNKEHQKKTLWKNVVTVLAAVVVFCTTYALILPAITLDKSLICEIPEHAHTDKCYNVNEETGEKVLNCGYEEHEHTYECYDAPKAQALEYFCGEIEHVHSVENGCYYDDGSIKCTLSEHEHTLQCKSNVNADVEDDVKWTESFKDVELSGVWADDVLAIAETQIDYKESVKNYTVMEDGETVKGYTRYGAWAKDDYADWNTLFCAFCLDYAKVSNDSMPAARNVDKWIELLKEKDLYREADSEYEPKPGDLVFFLADKEELTETETDEIEEPKAERVGFLYMLNKDGLNAIEGDLEDCVCNTEYKFSEGKICGYAELPEKPVEDNLEIAIEEPAEIVTSTIESEPAEDGAVAVITGVLPEGAEAKIKAVELTEEKLTEYLGESTSAMVTGYVAYDITILVNGEEWQPDETVSVVIRKPDIVIEEAASLAVAHVDGETDTVSEVAADLNETGDVTFEAEGFSTYLIYTVKFWNEDYVYSIDGHSELLLSELFIELGIDMDVSDVDTVVFSSPELITVEKTDDETDWKLITDVPFATEENLTVTFKDGSMISIIVTDDYEIVGDDGRWIYKEEGTEAWSTNNKLKSANKEYAYFYHTTTKVTTTYNDGGQKTYLFANDAPNTLASRTFDTIEFQNAFCYPNNSVNTKTYNICVKIHLNTMNSVPAGRTLRWNNNRVFLNRDDGKPYLSVALLIANNYSNLPNFDIDWEMWLEDPETHEKIDYIPLMGGSCYVGDEDVTVYSLDKTIYSNFPAEGSSDYNKYNHFEYNSTYQAWHRDTDDWDSPDFYVLGIAREDGTVKGRYVTPWSQTTATGTSAFACELTANLYEVPITISKTVEGTNSHVPANTDYKFIAGYYDPFNNDTYTTLGGYHYTLYNTPTAKTGTSGTIPVNGVFSLKDGQHITIEGLQFFNTPVRIEEYTSGTNAAAYAEYLSGTSVEVDVLPNATLSTDSNNGTKYVEYSIAGDSEVDFTNKLGEPGVTLKITKDVVGVTTDKEFTFTAEVDEDGEFLESDDYEIGEDGKITFTLADSDTKEIKVAPGSKVTITETDSGGFVTSFTAPDYQHPGTSDTFEITEDMEVTVNNTPGSALPATGGYGPYPYYIFGGVILAGAVDWYVAQKRKKSRKK